MNSRFAASTVIHALLARMGVAVRKRHEKVAPTDNSTPLYNRDGLLAQGNILLASCRGERCELTLALFDCDDLPEARQVYGTRTARKLIASIIDSMNMLAGERGLAGRTGPTQFAVLMPMGREQAVHAIARVLGNPSRFELDGGGSEIVLVPNVMVEQVPDAESLERLFTALCRGLARLRDEEILRNRYLKRERERHSRPMPMQASGGLSLPPRPASAPVLGPDPVLSQPIPTTIPMPLPTR